MTDQKKPLLQKRLLEIEANTLAHFKYLPALAHFPIKSDIDLTIINCGLGSSMFNIVYGNLKKYSSSIGIAIQAIVDQFQNQEFAWWVPRSLQTKTLASGLLQLGFIIESEEIAMWCKPDFNSKFSSKKLTIQQVQTNRQLEDFISILEIYDRTARKFYEQLPLKALQKQEKLFIGYHNALPVCVAILFIQDHSAAIFSLITCENFRGQGFGTDMMLYLMQLSSTLGATSCTLSASSDAGYRIYERLGFTSYGQFECFEWKLP